MHRMLIVVLTAAALPIASAAQARPARTPRPEPKVFELDSAATTYREILSGPPTTVTMRSGHVVLEPGKSVGKHSTEGNEEVVIVFSGVGELRLAGGRTFALKAGVVAYSPPRTVHDVFNTGTTPLRYLYVVSRAK